MTRTVHMLIALVLGLVSLGGVAPAQAAPNKIGPVQNLTLSAAPAPAGYTMSSSWSPLAGASSYRASLTDPAGVVLATVTVTGTTWNVDVAARGNTTLKVTVTPYDGKRPGIAASATTTTPDVRPPSGTFTVAWVGNDATVTQQSLTDDATAADAISRVITWGDGSAGQVWASGSTISYTYPGVGRYVPTLTLTDASGNAVTLTLHAVVIGDFVAPAGTFVAGPTRAIASWTKVTLTQTALADNYTPADLVERTVAWGDGTTEKWATGTTLTHTYRVAGTFTPSVTVVDEAGNSGKLAAEQVVVEVDSVGPAVKIRTPKPRKSVRKWRTVKGTATDSGTGLGTVSLSAIEKRDGRWYSYDAATKKWRAAKSKAAAWKRAKGVAATVAGAGWSARLAGLRKGTLLLRAVGADNVGNRTTVARKQVLTRR